MTRQKKKFDLRKSPIDGLIRKWELRWASKLFSDWSAEVSGRDHLVPVVTGVYRTRKDVFKEFKGGMK